MNEVATVSIKAESLVDKYSTLLSFVFGVNLRIFFQLVGPVGELALLLIRTKSVLNKLFTKLTFLFILLYVPIREFITVISWRLRIIS